MTRNRVIRMVVLCEDRQQEYFARHYFKLRGYDHKRMRFIVNPKGEGAGEQFVRQQYPDQVRAHRYQASSQSSVALVVLIDADMQTVDQRKNSLDTAPLSKICAVLVYPMKHPLHCMMPAVS